MEPYQKKNKNKNTHTDVKQLEEPEHMNIKSSFEIR